MCELAFENGTAVLMARIVDRCGVCIRPDQVAHVCYSIDKLNDADVDPRSAVPGHADVRLETRDVLFDMLQNDELWDVDAFGFNFRHEIRGYEDGSFPERGACYEIGYRLVPADGGRATLLRFQVRMSSHERRSADPIDSQPDAGAA